MGSYIFLISYNNLYIDNTKNTVYYDLGGGRTHNLLLRRQTRFHCATRPNNKRERKKIRSIKNKKGKASAGIEPTTFPLLGERTADYAKRPYMDKERESKRI